MASLDKNLFYNLLLSTYRKRYNEAADKCHTICVPMNDSYAPNVINDKFISAHILKPSPLLKFHLVAANNKHNFDVVIDGQVLKVTRGFGDKNCESIRILSEEIAYNSVNREYRIFIIETPLINSINRKLNYDSRRVKQKTSLMTFDDCKTFLRSVSVDLTDSLRSRVDQLLSTYIVLPNYIDDAAQRIKNIIDWAIPLFQNHPLLPEIATTDSYLETAIESYVIGLSHPKLLSAINSKCEREDQSLYIKFIELFKRNINPSDFGAQKAFESFTSNAVIIEELARMERMTTPLEKLFCLRKTLDLVSDQMTRSVKNKFFPLGGKSDPICIMSDDLIATVICVMTAVKPKRFESEINFIQTFSWNLPQNNEFGYSLVTFEVVKEFIKSYNLNQSESQKCDKSENRKSQNDSCGPYSKTFSTMSSPFDKELEKISKMIDNTNISLDSKDGRSAQNQSNDDLGEFLGSLSKNSFSVGFGKQF